MNVIISNSLRTLYALLACLVLAACSSNSSISSTPADPPLMVVHKSPTCGCCQAWVDYIEKSGFTVETHDHEDMDSIKSELGLHDPSLKSCHTAVIDGYLIEGHVPVSDIKRLLEERPTALGLTAPGMPMLSPGMGSEDPQDYDVLLIDKENKSSVFSSY